MTPEFWETIILLILVPLVQQIIKIISDQYGYTFEKWLNQLICLVLAALYAALTGGFAGIELPVWDGDLMLFLGNLVMVISGGWAALTLAYEVIWERLFKLARFATRDKFS